MCCNSWGRKELDMTEQLNRTELNTYHGGEEPDNDDLVPQEGLGLPLLHISLLQMKMDIQE